ncbi:MAG TPA: hypothetical protein VNG33_05505 [Polyangiaceae bacterium]|nr:hypothetical protein [Polyangiaceae bacterium]
MRNFWRNLAQPLRRNWRRATLLLVSISAGYLALVIHPQALFAHSLQRGNVVLYARTPLPPEAVPILDDAVRRISRSPLYDAARTHHVFLCDTPALYGFFTLWNKRSGGVTDTWAFGNAFIRPTNIAHNAVIGASGVEKAAPRTLAYYLAHEVTHAMSADHAGRLSFRKLAAFQTEGYADYVAFAEPVDLAQGRADFIAGTADMDPRKSGHYDRYRLLVGYLLQERKMSVDELLAKRLDRTEIEHELLAARLAQ